jgi:hypothetical protein
VSRALIALAGAALLALASPTATAQSTAADRALWDLEASTMENRDCKAASMARCWYLFFAINEAPVRQLWLLDLKVRNPERGNPDLIEIDIVQVHETDDPAVPGANDLVMLTTQYDCRRKKVRVADGYALMFNGTVDRMKEPSPWTGGYDSNWFGLAAKAACEKNAQLRPVAHSMLWIGDFYRPIDAADVTRRILWKQP